MGDRTVKQVKVGDLVAYENNSRTHSDEQVYQISRSIAEFGFVNPILIGPGNKIIAGHGRFMAAKALGLKTVPCYLVEGLSDEQIRAYVIADNQIANNAGWDSDLLRLELMELDESGFDLGLLGFESVELQGIMADPGTVGQTDPDDVPAPPEKPVSRPGDVWLLGKHRLMCGDSTDLGCVKMLLGADVPHLMVTDPPYGVEYDASWRAAAGYGAGGNAEKKVLNDDCCDWTAAWKLFPGDVAYVWHASTKANVVADSLQRCGFRIYSQIVWAKNSIVIGRGHYHQQHETCWYAVKNGATGHWKGSRKEKTIWRMVKDLCRPDEVVYVRPDDGGLLALSGDESTVWDIPKIRKAETGHSTQKPVECMARPIRNNSSSGDSVYEPFSGSGTTIIAAEQMGRVCYAMELSPEYVDIGVKRWEMFTGKKGRLSK